MRKAILSALAVAFFITPVVQAEKPSARDADRRPNFLIIIADDMGYSDISAFGSEIQTPNLDSIAKRGIRLTNLHVAPTCSPTRAMLLTGKDPHMVGLGNMAEFPMPEPRPKGYEGYLDDGPTLADRLRGAGYSTLISGKWHLGSVPGRLPVDRGFDRAFVLHQGGGSHFGLDQIGPWVGTPLQTTYGLDGKPTTMPIGSYTANAFTNRMIGFLKDQQSSHKPFFAYLAFTEPHWPLQAPADLIKRFRGRYDAGPEAIRAERLRRLKKMGLIGAGATPAKLDGPKWAEMSSADRKRYARYMEIYAAMVTSIDQNVGRVLHELRSEGRLDNTIILFMSDNGASGSDINQLYAMMHFMGVPQTLLDTITQQNKDEGAAGGPNSYVAYQTQWGEAAMAPFRLYKGFTTEGGVRAPAFISGPGIVGARNNDELVSVRDIMPTFSQLAGVSGESKEVEGGGRSWVPLLQGRPNQVRKPDDVLVTEFLGRRMVLRNDGWKAVFSDPGSKGLSSGPASHWQLFHVRDDQAELHDQAANEPDILKELVAVWQRYAAANNIIQNPVTTPGNGHPQ